MYRIALEEQDKIVSIVFNNLGSKIELNTYEDIAYDICLKYRSSTNQLTDKQQNVIGSIYYRQIYKWREPTKKMIEDARKTKAFDIAVKEEVESILKLKESFIGALDKDE